jgi:branched-subunit amino acid transport protein
MSDVWVVVVVVGAATVLFKAAGPVLLGRRPLPRRVDSVVQLLAPVMLTALVVTQTFGATRRSRSMPASRASPRQELRSRSGRGCPSSRRWRSQRW